MESIGSKELQDRKNDTAWSKEDAYVVHYGHGWSEGVRPSGSYDGVERVFSDRFGLQLHFRAIPIRHPKIPGSRRKKRMIPAPRRRLPGVSVIKAFVLRRHYYRSFSISKAIKPIVESLTELKEFIYEPIRHADTRSDGAFYQRLPAQNELFSETFSKRKETLRKVCIFDGCYRDREDWGFNEVEHSFVSERFSRWHRETLDSMADERKRLTTSLALRSRTLEELYASPTVDARRFFFPIPPRTEYDVDEWPRLKYLSLSAYFQTEQEFSQMLRSAAEAARRMPQLQVMELWSSRREIAFVFRYERKSETGMPRIVLRSSWAGNLSETVIKAWDEVALGHTKYFQYLERKCLHLSLEREEFKWQMLSLLALKGRMLNRTTLLQMEAEAKRYRWV